MRSSFTVSALALLLLLLNGCSEKPAPPEVRMAQSQEQRLWRAGAPDLRPTEYRQYSNRLRDAKDRFLRERNRTAVWRDYDPVAAEFRGIIQFGGYVLGDIRREKERKAAGIGASLAECRDKIKTIERLTELMNEGRLARRNLIKAQLLCDEADRLNRKENFNQAKERIFEAEICLKSAEAAIRPILSRFADAGLLARWRDWVNVTLADSKANGSMAIIVSKVDRTLVIYRSGVPWRSYDVGLGRNGFQTKLYAGDHATPEGRYHVTKKIARSKYHRALLINYPNEDDKARFAALKKKGLIPQKAGIGSLLEIHGGGDDGMTYGCIALDDKHMEELFNLIEVGTPVTIVGSVNHNNIISRAIGEL